MNQAFYTGALGAGAQMKKMDIVGNNLANVNTTGFKPQSIEFQALLDYQLNDAPEAGSDLQSGNGVKVQGGVRSFGSAGYASTQSEYDYAIMTDNTFFLVQDPQSGEQYLTRNGHFHVGNMEDEYFLMTDSGKYVLNQDMEPVEIKTRSYDEEEEEEEEYDEEEANLRKPGLFTLDYPGKLMEVSAGEYRLADMSVVREAEDARMMSHTLENSGTDMVREFVNMIESQRAYTYAVKIVQTADEIQETVNGLRR